MFARIAQLLCYQQHRLMVSPEPGVQPSVLLLPGTTVYTFTPDAGQCATTVTLSITVDPLIAPTFNPIDNVCQNSAAPVLSTSSLNGITGTWSPAVSTAVAGTTVYTFTPDAGQCATSTTISIAVDPVATGEETVTICESALPYSWNNQFLTEAGEYNAALNYRYRL
jgi:hypothetical protein